MAPGRVLITGGAGFLGSHLAAAFAASGVPVRLFDREAAPGSVEQVRGDIRDAGALAAAAEGVDAVIHAAFASPHEPAEVIRDVNVEGTRKVVVAAASKGVRRLVLVSSTIVLKPARRMLRSRSPLARLDRYRASRLEAEEIVAASTLSSATVRPKTFVGPGRVSAFAILFESARLGQPVPVLGTGDNRYQLLHIRDMAEGIRRLAGSDARGVFHLGAREFGTVREDLQALLDHAGTGARLRHVPGGIARTALRGMELAQLSPLSEWHYKSAWGEDSVVDISRAEAELGWRPEWSNARALRDGYDWYAEQMATRGSARSTHAIPRAHRFLRMFRWLLPG